MTAAVVAAGLVENNEDVVAIAVPTEVEEQEKENETPMPPSPCTTSVPEASSEESSPASAGTDDASSPTTTPTSASKADKATLQQKLRDNAVLLQLTKTKMCAFFQRGRCASKDCRYAHSEEELRPPPNLHKTKMCRAFMQGNCTDENCVFAHGDGDLKVTQGIYKTQMCNFFERGYCKKGDRCNHAHGNVDLRPPRKQADPFAPAIDLNKAVSSPTGAQAAPTGPLAPGAVAASGKENLVPATGGAANGRRQQRQKMALADLITTADNEANIHNMATPSAMTIPSPNKSVMELASMGFSPMPSSPLWGYGGSLFPPSVASPTHAGYDTSSSILGPYDPLDVILSPQAPPLYATPTSPFMSTGLPLTTTPLPPPPQLPPQLPPAVSAAQFASPFAVPSVADLVAPAPGLELHGFHAHSPTAASLNAAAVAASAASAATAWHMAGSGTSFEAPSLHMPFGWMSGLEHNAAVSTPTAQDAYPYTPTAITTTPLAKRNLLDPVAVNLSDKLSSLAAASRVGPHERLSIFTPEKAALPKASEGTTIVGTDEKQKKPHKTIKL